MSEKQVEASGSAYSTSRDLKRLFLSDFERLDVLKKDGMLTSDEIDTAVTDGTIKGEDAQLVAALKEYFGPLSKLINNQTGMETGITLADIEAFDRLQKQVNSPEPGQIPPAQADQLLVRGVDYIMAETKLAAMAASPCLYGEPDNPTVCVVPEAACTDKQHIDEGVGGIKPTSFRQGKLGDCYFMAALSSLAAVDPHAIVKMIKDNHNGTYTVTFPISPNEPITVSGPTEVERARYTRTYSLDNLKENHGDWPIIMEKAFGQWCINRPLRFWRRSPSELFGSKVPQENTDGGSVYHRGLMALTGKFPHVDFTINNSEMKLDATLQKVFAKGQPATAFISRRFDAIFGLHEDLTDDAKLMCGHEYGVLGYDANTKMVSIREPNAYFEPCDANGTPEDGIRDGVFKISLERFRKNFTGLAYPRR